MCKACAETRNQNKCEHSDHERSFIGTWTTDEINKALEKGYKVLRTYEVWHFDNSTDDLFKGYIRRFMKIKLESSNYDFKTKEEETNFKLKIKKSLDIDVEKLEFNAGLRSISKLCLNSLWGKFGQRSNMSQTKYVTEVSEFYEILLDGNTRFLWGGDFNTIFDISLDADGGSPQLYIKSVAKLLSMMSENDLCDIFRTRSPDSR